ncbi:hypothetical protein FPCIR_8669 [Fusarium pseudocircinatum]|uniref:Carboxylesterase type B domain-containing protein n=1 Tax=Fusarium pseudocircinatum TaxID=56676 RepID=A0A8H5P2S8_9HYPO|nr:hypothetical protein FPCIR_8669 [Fusarium pseudocircinatum]
MFLNLYQLEAFAICCLDCFSHSFLPQGYGLNLHWPIKLRFAQAETRANVLMATSDGAYLDETRQANIIVCDVVMWAFALILMVLRLYTRGLMTRAIGSEDWVLLAAAASSTALCGVIIYQVNKGLGLHSERVPKADWVYLGLAGWLAILFNTISLHLTKVSILLLYARVFTKRSYRIPIYIVGGVVGASFVYNLTITLLACRPIHGFWDPSSQTCLSSDYWIVSTVLHLGTDLIATILPLPILLTLNMNPKEKIILVILFALGFVVSVVSFLRLHYSLTNASSDDSIWASITPTYWACIEVNMAIICACLMTLRPLVEKYMPKLLRSRFSSHHQIPGYPRRQSVSIEMHVTSPQRVTRSLWERMTAGESVDELIAEDGNQSVIKLSPLAKRPFCLTSGAPPLQTSTPWILRRLVTLHQAYDLCDGRLWLVRAVASKRLNTASTQSWNHADSMVQMKCSGGKAPCDRCRKANSYCVFEPPQAAPPNGTEVPVQPEIQPLIVCATSPIEGPPGTSKLFSETRPTADYSTACSQHASVDDANFNFQIPVSLPSFDYSGNGLAPSQPNGSAEFSHRKKRRISDWLEVDNFDDTDSDTMVGDKDQDVSQASSPYQTVKDFEAAYWRVNSLEGTIPRTPTSIELGKPFPPQAMFPSSITDRGPLLYCLAEVGICEADARDMFLLFGERVASFMPGLYDAQFSDLPNDPLYALAAIKVMTRYLPSVDALRGRVDVVLQNLVRNILFDDLQRPFAAVLESIRGLSILYGYSEVTVARSQSDMRQCRADALSIKGVIEGYAIRRNIGRPLPSNALGCVLWLWLYTMSTHYVTLLGLPSTISADKQLQGAINVIKKSVSHPQVDVLLGEVDLCRISEYRRMAFHPPRSVDVPYDHDEWQRTWGRVGSQGLSVSRRLFFLYKFALFYHHNGHTDSSMNQKETLLAAQEFIRCITNLSPVSKGNIKYMCDFGFVMLVYACCYVLQRSDCDESCAFETPHRNTCLADIKDVADLLKSISPAAGAATSAYGRALEAACNRLSMHALALEHSMLPRQWDTERELDADAVGLIDIFSGAGAGTLQTASAQQSDGPMSGFQTISDIPVGDLLASLEARSLPFLELPYGTWQASRFDEVAKVYTFKNVRYAAPPIGNRRFAKPEPPEVEALKSGQKLPVMVFVHGGGYTTGSKDMLGVVGLYDGTGLVKQSKGRAIVIAINYRLGVFGWLGGTTAELAGATNLGLLDQRLAFEWIQNYIGLVGGDRNNVTAFGESAGGGSLMHHLTLGGGTIPPLFNRLQVYSAGLAYNFDRKGKLEEAFQKVSTVAGCQGKGFSCLRSASPQKLILGQLAVAGLSFNIAKPQFGPVPDGKLFHNAASLDLAAGRYWKQLDSVLVAHAIDDAGLFVDQTVKTDTDFLKLLLGAFDYVDIVASITAEYPAKDYSSPLARQADVLKDAVFACNYRWVTNAFPKNSYNMQFSGGSSGSHGQVLPGVFYNPTLTVEANGTKFPVDDYFGNQGIFNSLQSYIVSHAISGSPNTYRNASGTIAWPKVSGFRYENLGSVLNVTNNGFESITDKQGTSSRCDFWLAIHSQLAMKANL